MLDNYFEISKAGSNIRTEVVAGLTTFLTMAYIIFVNPSILATTGMDEGAVFVATCIAASIGSLIMGLWARYPIALAPGMGLNAYFAFVVVGQLASCVRSHFHFRLFVFTTHYIKNQTMGY